jgi:hypothetical protein
MQITGLAAERFAGGLRISARFTREESGAIEDVAFDVEGDAAEFARPAPEAFALIGALAAFHAGEKRVLIDGTLCPRFRDGVRLALRLLRTWYGGNPEPVLEATNGFTARDPVSPRAGLFLSGGADSLSALRANRLAFAPDHPAAYRDALFVVGYGVRGGNDAGRRFEELRARQRGAAEAVARIAGLDFLSVKSRVEVLGEDEEFFLRASHSAHLASVAHLFGQRLSSVSTAASYDAESMRPWGAHPMLDTNYGSSAVQIRHENFGLTRAERVALVADWKEALPYLTVCVQIPLERGRRNCGRCEKCVRTMLDLHLAGALAPPAPFPDGIDAELLEAVRISPPTAPFWISFPGRLRERGRADLAAIVERLLDDSRRQERWFQDRGWKGKLRRLDRRFLGGRLLDLSRRYRGAR